MQCLLSIGFTIRHFTTRHYALPLLPQGNVIATTKFRVSPPAWLLIYWRLKKGGPIEESESGTHVAGSCARQALRVRSAELSVAYALKTNRNFGTLLAALISISFTTGKRDPRKWAAAASRFQHVVPGDRMLDDARFDERTAVARLVMQDK